MPDAAEKENEHSMASLKALVIGLAVLIVIAMGMLAYGLATGAGKAGRGPADARPFGQLNLNLPQGCAIVGTVPDGRRLYLTVGPAGTPCRRIVVVDVETGTILGSIVEQP
jgi:hypothetical protein